MGQLVLSRKRGERVMIGDNVVVEVIEIGPGKVRLGFVAPQSVAVHREEIVNRILAEGERGRNDPPIP